MRITREVLLDADLDEVWQSLIDDELRAGWLEDDRPLEVLHARAGQTLAWRWTTPDGCGVQSVVELHLEEVSDGRTRLTVTEHATGSADCSLDAPTIDVDAWDRRLLGLELRCVLRGAAPVLV